VPTHDRLTRLEQRLGEFVDGEIGARELRQRDGPSDANAAHGGPRAPLAPRRAGACLASRTPCERGKIGERRVGRFWVRSPRGSVAAPASAACVAVEYPP
jgi:hypothetical protein